MNVSHFYCANLLSLLAFIASLCSDFSLRAGECEVFNKKMLELLLEISFFKSREDSNLKKILNEVQKKFKFQENPKRSSNFKKIPLNFKKIPQNFNFLLFCDDHFCETSDRDL